MDTAGTVGLNRVFAAVPAAYMTLKVLGALYLVLIAWRTWRDTRLPITEPAAPPLFSAPWACDC